VEKFTVAERNAIRRIVKESQAPLLQNLERRVTKRIIELEKRISELEGKCD
jgi:hypothetical protein